MIAIGRRGLPFYNFWRMAKDAPKIMLASEMIKATMLMVLPFDP